MQVSVGRVRRWEEGPGDLGRAVAYVELAPQDRVMCCVFCQKRRLYGCCDLGCWPLGCLRNEVVEVWGVEGVEKSTHYCSVTEC